jgi:prophage regulatory protein
MEVNMQGGVVELWRRPRVLQATGKKHAKFQKDITNGLFTPPVKDGRSSIWPDFEVAAINAARIAGKSDDEIKALVTELLQGRKLAMSAAA